MKQLPSSKPVSRLRVSATVTAEAARLGGQTCALQSLQDNIGPKLMERVTHSAWILERQIARWAPPAESEISAG
jgi:hypothetical protein